MSQYVSLPVVRLLALRVIDGGSVCKVCVWYGSARRCCFDVTHRLSRQTPVDVAVCAPAGGGAGAGPELRVWAPAQDKRGEKNGWIVPLKTTATNNQEVHPANPSASAESKIKVWYTQRSSARCWTAFSESLPIRDESLARNVSCVTDVNETKQVMWATGSTHREPCWRWAAGGGQVLRLWSAFACSNS